MDGGCSNSAFDLRSQAISLLQFLNVQKYSQTAFAKAFVEIGGKGFLAIRSTVINKDIVDIVVVVGI
jgi:hypothetical protein